MENNKDITLEFIINMNHKYAPLLYNYFFHFNHFKGEIGEWHAVPKDQIKNYLNGDATGVVMSNINDLQDIVDKIVALRSCRITDADVKQVVKEISFKRELTNNEITEIRAKYTEAFNIEDKATWNQVIENLIYEL